MVLLCLLAALQDGLSFRGCRLLLPSFRRVYLLWLCWLAVRELRRRPPFPRVHDGRLFFLPPPVWVDVDLLLFDFLYGQARLFVETRGLFFKSLGKVREVVRYHEEVRYG